MKAHPAAQAELDHPTLEPGAQPAKSAPTHSSRKLRIAMLEQGHRLQHFVHALVLGQPRDAQHQPRLYLFLRLQKPSILAPFSMTRMRREAQSCENISRSCWLTQTTAPTPPSERRVTVLKYISLNARAHSV